MSSIPTDPPPPPGSDGATRTADLDQNIEAVVGFYAREERKIKNSQRVLEHISRFAGRPIFVWLTLAFVCFWIGCSLLLRHFAQVDLDPPPFHWLQGIVGLGALLVATVVLTKQDRLARLAEQRGHLDLKVTLLTEQKTAKMIDLLEELRRDLPNVRDRHDAEARALQQPMNPDLVLAALDERKAAHEP